MFGENRILIWKNTLFFSLQPQKHNDTYEKTYVPCRFSPVSNSWRLLLAPSNTAEWLVCCIFCGWRCFSDPVLFDSREDSLTVVFRLPPLASTPRWQLFSRWWRDTPCTASSLAAPGSLSLHCNSVWGHAARRWGHLYALSSWRHVCLSLELMTRLLPHVFIMADGTK